MSQPDLAAKAGVGLRFVRELEQGKGKATLQLFGHELAPAPFNRTQLLAGQP